MNEVGPDTFTNYCHGQAFVLGGSRWDFNKPCSDCEWFGRWADAPEWFKEALRAENPGMVEVPDEG